MTLLRTQDGEVIPLDVGRWRDAVDEAERLLLASLPDPVLDVGCGPGRIAEALARMGRMALGIDPSPAAAAEARRRAAPVLERSVFAPLPGEGRWGSVVLLDGNVGIGGDPVRLLSRCAELVRPGGVVLAEVAGHGHSTARHTVRVESSGEAGPWFPWATVGIDGWAEQAHAAGLLDDGVDRLDHRWFARAVRP